MNRHRLADRRANESFAFEHAGQRYTCTVARFADGSIAEVFLNNSKASSEMDTLARDLAVVTSFALQYGAPIDDIGKALARNSSGVALSALGAALDLISMGIPMQRRSYFLCDALDRSTGVTLKTITCYRCGSVSANENDVAQRYCAQCKIFHDDQVSDERVQS